MFCIKCGAKLEDGARFCPQCGTAQTASAPSAPASTPLPSQFPSAAGSPAQPHRSSTQRQGAAAAPERGYAPPARQPVYAEPAPPAPKKKKKHVGLVVFLIIILAVAAAAYLNRSKISSFVMEKVAPAEKYYEHVERESIADLSANAAEAYDILLLSNANIDTKTTDGGLELRLGPAGHDLIMSAVGSSLQQLNPDEDLAWLQTLGVDTGIVTQDGKNSLQLKLKLNGESLVTLDLVADAANDKAFLAIPELKQEYLEMPLSQLESMSGSGPLGIVGMVAGLAGTDNEQMADAFKALPSQSKMEELIKKYLDMFIESAEEVEKDKTTLTVQGVSMEVTVLEITADGEAVAKAMENIFTEMKKDQDIKDIVVNMSEAQGEDGAEAYKSFLKDLDESLNDLDSIRENSSGFTMNVYTDAAGEIVGREFRTESFAYIMKKLEKGDKFGLEMQLGPDESALALKGKGTKSGDKLTGELDIEVGGNFMGVLALDGFDEEKFKKGMLSGAIEIRPSDALLNSAGSDSMMSGILRNFALRLEMDTGRDKGSMTLTVLSDGASLLSLSGSVNAKAGGRVNAVTGENMEKWSSEMDTDGFLMNLVTSLEKAGVPEAYTSMIPAGNG